MTELVNDGAGAPVAVGTDPELAGDPLEVVVAVWASVLDCGTVAEDVGFFDLGATSMDVVAVVRMLRGRWPRLQIIDVFAHPTVEQLAAFLDHA
jgi:hypothetical protein